jgi:hypothetical protein
MNREGRGKRKEERVAEMDRTTLRPCPAAVNAELSERGKHGSAVRHRSSVLFLSFLFPHSSFLGAGAVGRP